MTIKETIRTPSTMFIFAFQRRRFVLIKRGTEYRNGEATIADIRPRSAIETLRQITANDAVYSIRLRQLLADEVGTAALFGFSDHDVRRMLEGMIGLESLKLYELEPLPALNFPLEEQSSGSSETAQGAPAPEEEEPQEEEPRFDVEASTEEPPAFDGAAAIEEPSSFEGTSVSEEPSSFEGSGTSEEAPSFAYDSSTIDPPTFTVEADISSAGAA